jgi:hypothetical protein
VQFREAGQCLIDNGKVRTSRSSFAPRKRRRICRKEGTMDTERLRTIQQPSSVEALLESFVSCVDMLPEGARKLRERSDLPSVLQRLALNAKKNDKAWAAWTDDRRTWFFAAEMSMALSRERGRPVLQVDAYGDDGQLLDSGCWLAVRDGEWKRCAT